MSVARILLSLVICAVFSTSGFAKPKKPKKTVTIVKFDDASYKVRQRGDEATVSRQAIAFNANTSHFLRAKRAAELASDCKAIEVFPIFDIVNMKLDCSIKPDPNTENAEIRRNE
jgi:hypothetical protein